MKIDLSVLENISNIALSAQDQDAFTMSLALANIKAVADLHIEANEKEGNVIPPLPEKPSDVE